MPGSTGYRRLYDGKWIARNRCVYAGSDHVIMVGRKGATEQYRRYYYRDIQAVIIVRTRDHIIQGLVGIALLIMFLLPVTFGYPAVGIPLAIAGAALIAIEFARPSCECFIQTQTFSQRLWTIKRVSHARKFIADLEPLVTAAQADLDEPARLRRAELTQPPLPPQVPGQAPPAAPASPPPMPGAAPVGAGQAVTTDQAVAAEGAATTHQAVAVDQTASSQQAAEANSANQAGG